ncbi:alpha/beta hydrolase [Mycolicibacterium palauense]|uniref:alpha/beta hydrolase n=1 Tax=Mycolicibacterium palauense TaxID=2034511 RepID=UPI000BFED9C4|nr:alpha/beta hydrolase [Mycolicibacterium palauense]
MTLTVADIDRWDPGDVREVFHAAASRAQAAQDAANGLATLPMFESWGGEAAEAARQAIGRTRADLDAHGREALAVANAARSAADEIERIKSELTSVRADAELLGMQIDPDTGRVVAGPGFTGTPMEVLLKQQQLQPRVDRIVAEANLVDHALAHAIEMADGTDPIPASPHSSDPEVQAALNGDVPQDPQQFEDLWNTLDTEQKDWLYAHDHSIGNHPGMPWGSADDPGKDHYNRLHLDELRAANEAELQRLHDEHPQWGANPTAPSEQYLQWRRRWDDATRRHDEYAQVRRALDAPDGMPRLLGLLDDQGHAAVAVNSPDTARRTATFVPGTGQDLSRLEYSTAKSQEMLQATLRADPTLDPGDVSVVTWMGYDRPMSVITDAPSTSYAHNGAQALDDFQDGLRVTHDDAAVRGASINTVIGHSYGSTVVGAAGLDGHHLDADNVVTVGSPGVLAGHASDLSLAPGARVFAARAENDIIGIATYASLGPDPMGAGFGAIPFEAAPGPAGPFGSPTVEAHSSYWSAGNPALTNMGRIIAGQTDVTAPTFTP